ncbi:unnamed protein product, partial [Urochloa humidicola]
VAGQQPTKIPEPAHRATGLLAQANNRSIPLPNFLALDPSDAPGADVSSSRHPGDLAATPASSEPTTGEAGRQEQGHGMSL